ncbi:retrotransposon-related protein [Tanacetum coccineum]|uniref:Retrotransposon-related protein n=1 Tax=Tanacetum coccineum TaxID=301880 RepID=A0ABQ5AXW5_9ASTR
MLDQRLTTPFQSKWLPKLLGFDYDIEYKKGVDNAAADALSRIERQGELFSLLAGTSNELLDAVIATWSTDPVLKTIVDGLKNNIGQPGKYVWHNNQLRRKDKWVVGQDAELRKKNKSDLSASPGLLQPLPIPERIWQDISMDFIESLPLSNGKSALLVVVDRLSKFAHFLSITHPYTTSQIAQLFLDNVYKLHGLPKTILQPYGQLTVRQGKHNKLSSKYFGPFQVIERIRIVAYRLQLPPYARVHPVFYVSQMKRCHVEADTMGKFPQFDDEGLLADTPLKLLERKIVKQNNKMVIYALIQWSNGEIEDATWEKLEDIVSRFPEFVLDP